MLATPPGEGEKNERIREWKKMRKRRWHAVRLHLHAPRPDAGHSTWGRCDKMKEYGNGKG
jgi:hypothetical protein